jgi:peroxiredoxin
LPSVNRLFAEFRDKGFQVVLVSFREDVGLVKRTVRERGYQAPVLIDASGDVTGRVYGVFGPPTLYVIDRQGRLLARAAGPRDWDSPAGRRFVETVLGQQGDR